MYSLGRASRPFIDKVTIKVSKGTNKVSSPTTSIDILCGKSIGGGVYDSNTPSSGQFSLPDFKVKFWRALNVGGTLYIAGLKYYVINHLRWSGMQISYMGWNNALDTKTKRCS